MLIVSCFKFIFCYSYVCVFLVGVFLYDCGLVNNSFLKALAWVSWDNRNSPTSSQVSEPSKLPIVTSKSDLYFAPWHVIAMESGLFLYG